MVQNIMNENDIWSYRQILQSLRTRQTVISILTNFL
jgi:hypothetical protein